ncbi:transglutaminase [Aeromonas hydrophila]|nr:transglutaminase [Aeromonas hydrophila]
MGANLDYKWTRWVLNYDAASLWQQLGQRWPVLAGHTHWLILAALLGVASLVGSLLIWRGPAPLPLRLWQPLRRRAARHGWQPLAGESLASWCERLADLRPSLARPLQQGAWLYRRWRYAPLSAEQRHHTLRQLQRRLRQICRRWDARH